MAFRPEVFRPIEAQGTLRLDTPGGRSLKMVADGELLRVELRNWQEMRELIPRSFHSRRQALRVVADLFARHGLTLSLESAGKPVLRLGHTASASWFARLLGLAPAFVPVSAIALLFTRTPRR